VAGDGSTDARGVSDSPVGGTDRSPGRGQRRNVLWTARRPARWSAGIVRPVLGRRRTAGPDLRPDGGFDDRACLDGTGRALSRVRHFCTGPASGTGYAARLDVALPQQLLLGVTHQANDDTMLALGLSWQDWSDFGESKLQLPGSSSPMIANGLQDTWGASIGVRRTFGDDWAASTGVSYESNPATAGGVPAYFPVAEQWRIAAGAEHSFNDAMRLRAELSVVLQGTADVVQLTHPLPLPGIPPLTGEYRDTRVYMLAIAADFTL
jgi:hypothetical protein